MIRSLVFTTQGRLHSRDVDCFLIPTILNDTNLFLWVDLDQSTPQEARQILETTFNFHPLEIEDCLAADSSPKVEEYVPREEDKFAPHLFIVVHAVDYNRKDGAFATSELNLFLGKNFLVTAHAVPLKVVSQVLESVGNEITRTAKAPDRLAHMLLDALVDHYKPAMDELAQEIGALEEQALARPSRETLNKILVVKREVYHLRAIIGPQREILGRFARGEFKFIRAHLVPYYRDVYDGLVRIADLAQGYADALTGVLQVYLNMSSNQTGEIVKILTMITVITTPLMMIGTWYGMNFHDMPELSWRDGYLVASIVMVMSTLATYWYFKKKKWF
jgi:magnesium transporter